MMSDDDEVSEQQAQEQEFASKIVHDRLKQVEAIYQNALTSMWLANGAAASASLAFIGGTWKTGMFPRQLLIPLSSFVVGLIFMGIGTFCHLFVEQRKLSKMERAHSWLDLPVGLSKTPTARAGLTFSDWRTAMAMLSALCFVFGCVFGLIEFWYA
jgi:hypothetical protein